MSYYEEIRKRTEHHWVLYVARWASPQRGNFANEEKSQRGREQGWQTTRDYLVRVEETRDTLDRCGVTEWLHCDRTKLPTCYRVQRVHRENNTVAWNNIAACNERCLAYAAGSDNWILIGITDTAASKDSVSCSRMKHRWLCVNPTTHTHTFTVS